MMETLLAHARLSVSQPRAGMRNILDMNLDTTLLWRAMVLVAAASALLYNLALVVAPPPPGTEQMMPRAPLLLALLMAGGLLLTVVTLHYAGRMFDGAGDFAGALSVVVWLQVLLLLAQIPQIVLLVVAPLLGNLFGLGVTFFAVWLFVNFVAELHGFRSLAFVFLGIILSGVAVMFGLSIVMVVLNLALGLDLQNV